MGLKSNYYYEGPRGLQQTSLRGAAEESVWGDEAISGIAGNESLQGRRLLRPGYPQGPYGPRNDGNEEGMWKLLGTNVFLVVLR